MNRCGKVPDEMPADELSAALKKLLQPIKVRTFKPAEELIASISADFTLEALEGNGQATTNRLIQSVRDAIEGVYDA